MLNMEADTAAEGAMEAKEAMPNTMDMAEKADNNKSPVRSAG